MKKFFSILFFILIFCNSGYTNQVDLGKIKIIGTINRPSGIYDIGEKIYFNFKILKKDGSNWIPCPQADCLVKFEGNNNISQPLKKITSDNLGNLTINISLHAPGSVRCKVSLGKFNGVVGAVVAPKQIKPGHPEPADFGAYWQRLKQKIDQTPLNAQLHALPNPEPQKKVDVFDLVLPCPGSKMPVTGILVKPRNVKAHSIPAILHVQWATVRSAVARCDDGQTMLALEINANGVPNGKTKEYYQNLRKNELKKYWYIGMTDRDEIYFRDMFLRVYRALQYLKSRPEWDGKTLIVTGTSQGGGQALAAGGLDPQVSAIIATVPALCDHGGNCIGRQSGWPEFYKTPIYHKYPQRCANAASYIDAAYFAARIKKAEVFMATGLIDYMCSTSSVCSAFNAIPSPHKKLMIIPTMGHFRIFPEVLDAQKKFLKQHIKHSQNL